MVDVGKFVEATLADLAACVAARNAGSEHWAEDLLDEKTRALTSCGVEVQVREVQ